MSVALRSYSKVLERAFENILCISRRTCTFARSSIDDKIHGSLDALQALARGRLTGTPRSSPISFRGKKFEVSIFRVAKPTLLPNHLNVRQTVRNFPRLSKRSRSCSVRDHSTIDTRTSMNPIRSRVFPIDETATRTILRRSRFSTIAEECTVGTSRKKRDR